MEIVHPKGLRQRGLPSARARDRAADPPGTPSQKAGLSPGDEILAINGYIIGRLDLEQLPQLLSQSRQRQAQLDVRRPGVPSLMHSS